MFAKLKGNLVQTLIIAILVLIIVVMGILWFNSTRDEPMKIDVKTTMMRIEDLGELVTQAGYYASVSDTQKSAQLWGKNVPLTKSRALFSYNGVIKVGYDCSLASIDVKGKRIIVSMPEVKIISNVLDNDSLKVYDEKDNLFSEINVEAMNASQKELKERAEQDMIEQGIYIAARENAEKMLTTMISSFYDLNEYTIEFVFAEPVAEEKDAA